MDEFAALQEFDLAIGGMTCASCVARVERNLSRVPGVRDVTVNLATEMAHLRAPAGTAFSALVAAVDRAGYRATPRAQAVAYDGRRERWELAAAFGLSAPLFAAMALPLPGWWQLALATVVQVWLGARFYVAGAKALRAGAGNMDLLVALGTSAAYALSVVDFAHGGPLYFESSAAVITLVRLGKYLEGGAKRDAARAVSGLGALRPARARVQGRGEVALADIRVGDVIDMRPGERVPADGVIVSGSGSFDESHITGEPLGVVRGPGEAVLAGALNLDARLDIRVSAAAGETLLDRMARLIEAAQGSKPQIQRLADQVAAVFVPVVIALAAATGLGWLLAGAPPSRAIIIAVSVLVIACPCALGLATPAALLAGTAAAAKHGILIRNAQALETAAGVDTVVFDKTGTLTAGRPCLAGMTLLGAMAEPDVRRIAAALAAGDSHPLSSALRIDGVPAAADLTALPGRGLAGSVGGVGYRLGTAALMASLGAAVAPETGTATWSYLATAGGEVLAAFAFTDALRPDARHAVERLRAMGCAVKLLSGDREPAVRAVAQALGVDDFVAAAGPADKTAVLRAAQAAGRQVAMVGDGVNDAAALAVADCSIAIGGGADIAIETADISLLRAEPALVADALALCRRTRRVLRQGLFWAMIYNVIGIPAAACGLLSPTIAGAAMAASSVCVLANALRLRRWRPK
jgi:Cu+-exporting ATPase